MGFLSGICCLLLSEIISLGGGKCAKISIAIGLPCQNFQELAVFFLIPDKVIAYKSSQFVHIWVNFELLVLSKYLKESTTGLYLKEFESRRCLERKTETKLRYLAGCNGPLLEVHTSYNQLY